MLCFLLCLVTTRFVQAQEVYEAPVAALIPRWGAAMAYDPLRKVTVMYGGQFNARAGTLWFLPMQTTWELGDGARDWRAKYPVPNPGRRSGATMAWDPVRKAVVLFGGSDGSKVFDDMWSWDGRKWERIALSSPRPPGLWHQSMTLDESRNEIVMYGGGTVVGPTRYPALASRDTWIWNGTAWRLAASTLDPGPRALHAAVYSPRRKSIVVLAGFDGGAQADAYTWEWRFGQWSKLGTAVTTPVLNWDSVELGRLPSGDLLAIGSEQYKTRQYDVWIWAGKDWSKVTRFAAGPTPRASWANVCSIPSGILHFDGPIAGDDSSLWSLAQSASGELQWTKLGTAIVGHSSSLGYRYQAVFSPLHDAWILHKWGGGVNVPGHFEMLSGDRIVDVPDIKDLPISGLHLAYDPGRKVIVAHASWPSTPRTWEWSNGTWAELKSKLSPPAVTSYSSFVYDSKRRRLVYIANSNAGGIDFWFLDAQGWHSLPAGALPNRSEFAVVYDSHRDRIVLFGTTSPPDVCEWDGSQWTCQPVGASGPAWRTGHKMFYHVAHRKTYLVGGGTPIAPGAEDVWAWDGTTWQKVTVSASTDNYNRPVAAGYDTNRDVGVAFYMHIMGHTNREYFMLSFGAPTFWGEHAQQFHQYLAPGERCELTLDDARGHGGVALLLFSGAPAPGRAISLGAKSLFLPMTVDPLLQLSLQTLTTIPLNSSGRGRSSYTIPNLPALRGLDYVHACLVFDKLAQPVGFTNTIHVHIEP